jgi:hypothetical protein
MPARPENDENMEPQGPRMRSISLEPRWRPFLEDGGGAAAPPPVYVPAARPLGNLPKIQMPEFKGKKGVPAQMWLESLPRFQKLYQLTDAHSWKWRAFRAARVNMQLCGQGCCPLI